MAAFRFEDLEIWKLGSEIGYNLFEIADMLSEKKKFRFSEQLYGAAMSIIPTITPIYRYSLFLFPFLFVRKYFQSYGYSNIFCLNKEKNNSIYLSIIWNYNWYNK